jgi:hypothetical protein
VSGTEAHGGSYAMKIKTVNVSNNPLPPGSIPNPAGIAFTGKVNISGFTATVKQGYAYTSRPANADFWYKYSPVGSDSAVCLVILSKWNTSINAKDTLATGFFMIKSAASSYTHATFSLIYNLAFPGNIQPDTMFVYFSATCWATLSCGTTGSTLWVDDFAFSGWNGIMEFPASSGVTVHPNPAIDYTTISVEEKNAEKVFVFDVTGRRITTIPLYTTMAGFNRKTAILNTTYFPAGMYSYIITDSEGASLKKGKLSIVR